MISGGQRNNDQTYDDRNQPFPVQSSEKAADGNRDNTETGYGINNLRIPPKILAPWLVKSLNRALSSAKEFVANKIEETANTITEKTRNFFNFTAQHLLTLFP